jgi:hypothetical protein
MIGQASLSIAGAEMSITLLMISDVLIVERMIP